MVRFKKSFITGRVSPPQRIEQVIAEHVEDCGRDGGALENVERQVKGLVEVLGYMAEVLTVQQKITLAQKMYYEPVKEDT